MDTIIKIFNINLDTFSGYVKLGIIMFVISFIFHLVMDILTLIG